MIKSHFIHKEGKKQQIRNMLTAIGYSVKKLGRTAYGELTLHKLRRNKYRHLTKKDLKKIFSGKIPFTIRKIPDYILNI